MEYKWNILINQRAAIELGLDLDIIDLAIFDYIKGFVLSSKCTKVNTEEGTFYWVSHKNIKDSMPLLNIKSDQGIVNRIKKLITAGLLIKYSRCDEFGKTLYSFGQNYDSFEYFGTPQQNLGVPTTKLEGNIILNNNNPQLSKDNIPQGGERESEVVEVVEDDGFETAWVAYGRKGNKKAAKRYWKKLSLKDRKAIMEKIPLYLKANPDEQFRKDFSGFINPSYRRWEDKIIDKTLPQQRSKGSDIPDWMTPEGRKRQEQMDNLVEAIWNG